MIAVATLALLLAQDSGKAKDPLPDGAGKKVVEKICLQCHGASTFTDQRLDQDGWEQVIDDMISKGAQGTNDEFDQIVDYLTKYFGKK